MTQPSTRPHRQEVEFPPNVPVTVALKYAQPKLISGQYGERYLFTTVDNRVMFLDPEVAGEIVAQGINVRENFTLTRRAPGHGEPICWHVQRLAGEQPNGTYVVPAAPAPTAAAPVSAVSAKPPQSAPTAQRTLVEETNALIDAFAQVLERTLTTYQGRIKPDEVKAILLSAYIGRRQSAA